jgi:ABC-2 type transport system permease protein
MTQAVSTATSTGSTGRHRHATVSSGERPRPGSALARLMRRLVRRSTIAVTIAVAAWLYLEVVSYELTYPDGVPAADFALFVDNPAVRMLQGVPTTLDNPGAFAMYDAGWMIALLLALWAIMTSTRLLRAEEETERVDLLLTGPLRASTATWLPIAVLAGAAAIVGLVGALTMVAAYGDSTGSALMGLAMLGLTATFAGVGAVTSQLVEVRRRAAGIAAGVLGATYVLRMIANSTDERIWLRWTSPLGWFEALDPYGSPDLRALVPLLLAPLVLVGVALVMRARRDTGAGLLASESGRTARLGLLGSPIAFAWRSGRMVLLAWAIGLAGFAALMGGLLASMVDLLLQDETYVQMMETFGLADAFSLLGFLGFVAGFFGVAVALQASWRVGVVRAEEESGRAEALLSRRVSRTRWLGGHVLLTVLGSLLLLVLVGTAQWFGVLATGADEVSWWQSTASALNLGPVVALVIGVGVAAFGLVPRLTVILPATLTGVSYVLTLLGPALDWPSWVLNLSPFTHLALVPADPWAATSGLVMLGLGAALVALGMVAFDRRDITGA